MTFRSAIHLARRMASGDPQTLRYFPYQLRMRLHRVDLGWSSVQDNGLPEERCHWHSDSGGPDLDDLLRTLPIRSSDKLIDLGCGKGGAMLTLARYPFARVDGVEISPKLAHIARKNLGRMGVLNATVFVSDAADFTDLDQYTHIYMYNPFPETVMRTVAENIEASLRRRDRVLTLIYKNPVFSPVLEKIGFSKVHETQQKFPDYPPFSVYIAHAVSCAAVQ